MKALLSLINAVALMHMGLFTLPSMGSWQSFALTAWLTFHFSLDPHLSLPCAAWACSGTLGSTTTQGPAGIPCPQALLQKGSSGAHLLTAQSTLTGRTTPPKSDEQPLKTPKKTPSHICKCCAGTCAAREQQWACPTVPVCERWSLANEETWPLQHWHMTHHKAISSLQQDKWPIWTGKRDWPVLDFYQLTAVNCLQGIQRPRITHGNNSTISFE